jgi:actin
MKALSKTNTTNKPYTVEMVRDMKEKLCYIHEDFRSATNPHSKQPLKNLVYELPDGSVISLPADPFIRGPEALFNPSVIDGSEHKSLASLAAHSISKCDDDLQVDLYGTVVLAGGTSIIPGFADRLEKDITREAPADKKVAVLPGTILSMSASFPFRH